MSSWETTNLYVLVCIDVFFVSLCVYIHNFEMFSWIVFGLYKIGYANTTRRYVNDPLWLPCPHRDLRPADYMVGRCFNFPRLSTSQLGTAINLSAKHSNQWPHESNEASKTVRFGHAYSSYKVYKEIPIWYLHTSQLYFFDLILVDAFIFQSDWFYEVISVIDA